MFVMVGENKWKVTWKHYTKEEDMENGFKICECNIYCDGVGDYHGMAFCHPNDNYMKETGSKIALTQALYPFTREQQTLFWTAYFNRK